VAVTASSNDGGRHAARGFQYQYLRTLESLLHLIDDNQICWLRVEGDPNRSGQDIVDFDLLDTNGRCVLAVQVKSKALGGTMSAAESYAILHGLITQQDARSYELWTNAKPGSGASEFAELLAQVTDTSDLRQRLRELLAHAPRRLVELDGLTAEQLDRLQCARVRFDARDEFEIRDQLSEKLRGFRNQAQSGLGDRSAGLLTGYLIAEVLRRAADSQAAKWSRAELREMLLVSGDEVAKAMGRRDWGVVVGPMPPSPDVLRLKWLAKLRHELPVSDDRVVRQVALVGPSGIGKSSLAAGYVVDRAYAYDQIFWIDAESDASIIESYRTVLSFLRRTEDTDPVAGDPVQLREQVRAELARHPGRWAIVLDNATSIASLAPWLPAAGRGDLLITSLDAGAPYPQTRVLEVGPMTQPEATDLMGRRLTRLEFSIDPGQLAVLADAVEYWPLALELLSGYIVSCSLNPDQIDDFLDQVRQRALSDSGSIPAGYPRTLVAAIELCLEPFRKQQRAEPDNPRATLPLAIMTAAAMLASRRIPAHLLAAALQFDLEASRRQLADNGLMFLPPPALELDEALRELRHYSLIAFDEQLPSFDDDYPAYLRKTIRLNTIVQELIHSQEDLSPDPILVLEGLAIQVNLWLTVALHEGRWRLVQILFTHAQALIRCVAAYRFLTPSIMVFAANLGLMARLNGNYEVAEQTWRMCVNYMVNNEELRDEFLTFQTLAYLTALRIDHPDRTSITLEELTHWLGFMVLSLMKLAPENPDFAAHLLALILIPLRSPTAIPLLESSVELARITATLDDLSSRLPSNHLTRISAVLGDIETQLSSGAVDLGEAEQRCRNLLAEPELAAMNQLGPQRALIEILMRGGQWPAAHQELSKFLDEIDAALIHVDVTAQLIQNVGLGCAAEILIGGDSETSIAAVMLAKIIEWPPTEPIMAKAGRKEQQGFRLLRAIHEFSNNHLSEAEDLLFAINIAELNELGWAHQNGRNWKYLWQHMRLRLFRAGSLE
jgi:hypothetical protein